MKRYHVILAALASLAGTSAAMAAAPGSAANQSTAQAPREPSGNQQARKDRQICVLMALTGSRIPRKICRTEAQWEDEGGVPTK